MASSAPIRADPPKRTATPRIWIRKGNLAFGGAVQTAGPPFLCRCAGGMATRFVPCNALAALQRAGRPATRWPPCDAVVALRRAGRPATRCLPGAPVFPRHLECGASSGILRVTMPLRSPRFPSRDAASSPRRDSFSTTSGLLGAPEIPCRPTIPASQGICSVAKSVLRLCNSRIPKRLCIHPHTRHAPKRTKAAALP